MKLIRLFSLLTLCIVLLSSCATNRNARRVYDDRNYGPYGGVYGGPVYRRVPPRQVIVVPQGRPVYPQRRVYSPPPRGNAYGHQKQIYRRYENNRRDDDRRRYSQGGRADNENRNDNRGRSRGGR